ncbi:MAG TPA: sigma 54-interacting transcriptional regulator [Bryobacteraceae bacterium]|nr:sigma 54-interacting transcriptional regulator [Bryobacteraceae bacterium]
MSNIEILGLLSALDNAVLRKDEKGRWRLVETPPEWFIKLYPGAESPSGLHAEEWSPFLETFLENAGDFLCESPGGRLKSGPWTESTPDGEEIDMEATILRHKGKTLLVLTHRGEEYGERRQILQKAREKSLKYQKLERVHDELALVLNQLEVGALTTDAAGRCVFLSEPARRLFDMDEKEVLGRRWLDLKILDSAGRRLLELMARLLPAERTRVPLHWERDDGRAFWMEVDLRDHPKDARKKIVFLYDVSELHSLRRLLGDQGQFENLVGKNDAMRRLYQSIENLTGVDTTVLIEGETGTGKELVARAIHNRSERRARPFVAINCAGLTESLVSSQLFGHRRGAFTGALQDSPGLFEAAEGGVLFLDEIGDLPLAVQTSLLRVLQEREITRLGETRTRKVNVRVLAATHRNLTEETERGNFRADLLYRIRVARIQIPALRDHLEDIPLLVSRFLADFRASTGKMVLDVSAEAMRALMRFPWPGNVRELRSAIEFAVINCRRPVLALDDLPPEISARPTGTMRAPTPEAPPADEKERILSALRKAGGKRSAAAKLLGISRATLYRRMADLKIPAGV